MKLSTLRLLAIVAPEDNLVDGTSEDYGNGRPWPARNVRLTPLTMTVIAHFLKQQGTYLEQRCLEFQTLFLDPEPGTSFATADRVLREVFPYDASCEDVIVQPDLPFLDRFVTQQRARGAAPYVPPDRRRARPTVESTTVTDALDIATTTTTATPAAPSPNQVRCTMH